MSDSIFYAVFLFPQALELLAEPIKPYLVEGPAGPHIVAAEVDTSGSFVEITMRGQNPSGSVVDIDLMIPHGMIRLIMSVHGEADFGFVRNI